MAHDIYLVRGTKEYRRVRVYENHVYRITTIDFGKMHQDATTYIRKCVQNGWKVVNLRGYCTNKFNSIHGTDYQYKELTA